MACLRYVQELVDGQVFFDRLAHAFQAFFTQLEQFELQNDARLTQRPPRIELTCGRSGPVRSGYAGARGQEGG